MFGFVRIKKCCDWGSYLDEMFNCVPAREDNVEAEAIFREAIKDLGVSEVTVEVDENAWRRCDRKQLKELDVLHILRDNNSSYVYAIIDLNLVDSNETEVRTSAVRKMRYLCLDLELDLPPHLRSLKALVCLTAPSHLERPEPLGKEVPDSPCVEGRGGASLCVSKCYPASQLLLNTDHQICGPPAHPSQLWTNSSQLQLHHANLSRLSDSSRLANLSLSQNFLHTNRECQTLIVQARTDRHLLISNGSLYHPESGFKDNFCIDNGMTSNGEVVEVVVECYHDQEVQDDSSDTETCLQKHGGTFRLANTISCSLSAVFLTLTALVYIFVPDLNYLQGKIILSNVLAVFFLSVFLLIIYNKQHILSYPLCISLGYFGYFCTISMFSWMTIMSFDVCWMLKQSKVPRRDSNPMRFLAYSVLGWGSSALLTLLVASLDHIPPHLPPQFKPNIGLQHCFVQNSSHGLYLYLPISVFMILNGILFVTTICVVYR